MKQNNHNYDVIIIGGSYAGLSAGLALGRALRNVLIVDSVVPCNRQTPHSHNFLTQDGSTPMQITSLARQQLEKYDTIQFIESTATTGIKTEAGFEITLQTGEAFKCRKLIIATGIKDLLPDIEGFDSCWGISIIHCPYCHGYEYRNQATGIWANGEMGFEFAKMISNWTKNLTLFTSGKSTLNDEQTKQLENHSIGIEESEVVQLEHVEGTLQNIVLKNGSKVPLKAMYARVPFVQHSDIPEKLGCEITEQGHLIVDPFQTTSVRGIFACGDNCSPLRSVANAVASGNVAGAMANRELIEDDF